MRVNRCYWMMILCGLGLGTQAEELRNSDFSAGAASWTTVTQPGSSVLFSGGVASFSDTGDSKENSHFQSLCQDLEARSGDTIHFSFDLRFDEPLKKTWRVSLYNGSCNGGDVFRSFFVYHKKTKQWRFNVVSAKNKIVNVKSSVSVGDWVRISGTINLKEGVSSGTIMNQTTEKKIDRWSGLPLFKADADTLTGFAVYDPSGVTKSSAISLDNVNLTSE
jgi:hypothetical protein